MVIEESCTRADIDFQGKHSEERYQFHFHQHWIRMLWPLCKLIALNAILVSAGVVAFSMLDLSDPVARRSLIGLFSLLFLFSHWEFLCRFYRYYLYVVVVTGKKIHRIKKSLILIDDHQGIDLWMIQDINKIQHGLLQNILGYGTIKVEAQETILRIHFVPHVARRYVELVALREQARRRMNYPAADRKSVVAAAIG